MSMPSMSSEQPQQVPQVPQVPPAQELEVTVTPDTGAVQASTPRDALFWAEQVSTLKVTGLPREAINLNVEGRRVVGPLQGFGRLWQKTYWVRLRGVPVTPAEVIKTWKEQFPTFWPQGNRFYGPLTGIAPGEVAVLSLKVAGPMRLSTGVLVLYADDESFTLMTPQGHMFAGWITFSAYELNGGTIAQAELLIRANDPLYEIGMRLGGFKQEDRFWEQTLAALAAHFGVHAPVQMRLDLLDPRLQWSQLGNVWQNAAVRTTFYTLSAPARWVRGRARR